MNISQQKDVKIFEDSVHGHITIPKDYCREIIDNWLFQRLRRIEQTSVRPIFPSAHHDRFIHSLGVFHIGEKIFKNIQENTSNNNKDIYNFIKDKINPTPYIVTYSKNREYNDGYWTVLEKTYGIACLLHDCGHAPFSHTFENYYYNQNDAESYVNTGTIPINKDLIKEYSSCVNENPDLDIKSKKEIIKKFVNDLAQCRPKSHESISAWLVLHNKGFRRKLLDKIKVDPLLIARMITGCYFKDKNNPENATSDTSEQILNCFISLLNGHQIDADRLDYAARDKWATGLNTATINIDRILYSIHISKHKDTKKNDKYIVCFKKNGLSELQGLLDVKNFTSFWIFNHPKVKYSEELLIKSVKRLALLFQKVEDGKEVENKVKKYYSIKIDNQKTEIQKKREIDILENEAMYDLFNYKNLIEPRNYVVQIDDETYCESIFLMCDDDIVHLLKKFFCVERSCHTPHSKLFFDRAVYAKEWFSRSQVYIPIWKSYVEYNSTYYKPYGLELRAINRMLDCISELKDKNDINEYLQLFSSDKDLKLLLSEIKLFNRNPAVKIILENFKKKSTKSENLYEEIQSYLKLTRDKYDPESFFDRISYDVSTKIIKWARRYYKIKQGVDEPKVIKIENLLMNEITADSLYIEINKDICCYTDLDLPIKNKYQEYNFSYIFLPKIYDKEGGGEISDIDREIIFRRFKKALHKAYCPTFDELTNTII